MGLPVIGSKSADCHPEKLVYPSTMFLFSVKTNQADSDKLHITLNHSICINRTGMTPALINFLKKKLNFSNSEYYIKKENWQKVHGV